MSGSMGKVYGVTDPSTGTEYRLVAASVGADVSRAANQAEAALDGPWPDLSAADRSVILRAIADGIDTRAEDIADLEVRDTGLPIAQVPELAAQAATAFRECADAIEATPDGEPGQALRGPGGVAGLVAPWTAPFLSAARMLAPALAAGCAVIVKSDEWTPMSSTILPEIMAGAQVPAGVFSLLHGRRADGAAAALLSHPAVPLVAFAGDAAAVRKTAGAAPYGKRLSLRSTGPSPCVIFADADLDRAVDAAVFGAFALNGAGPYGLGAGSRILVEDTVYADVVARLASRTRQLRVGPPDDLQTQIGPLVHEDLRDQLAKFIRLGLREEARLAAGGTRPAGLPDGYYLTPLILADVAPGTRVFTEEVAGPVACVTSFTWEDEVAEMANKLLGRAPCLWTADHERAGQVAALLDADTTWVNAIPQPDPVPSAIGFFTRTRTVRFGPDGAPVPSLGG